MKFEDLIDKPIEELTDDEIKALIEKLSSSQLQVLERNIKKKMRSRKVKTKAKKEREDEFNKLILQGGK